MIIYDVEEQEKKGLEIVSCDAVYTCFFFFLYISLWEETRLGQLINLYLTLGTENEPYLIYLTWNQVFFSSKSTEF